MILPITIPLILSLSMMESILNNPDGILAFWMSIFPLSSPIVMMARLPFGGVEGWEIILSMTILIIISCLQHGFHQESIGLVY